MHNWHEIANPTSTQRPSSSRGVRRVAAILILQVLMAVGLCSVGCRTFRSRRHTQELSDARQNSLRGAEKLQQNKLKDAELLFAEALRRSAADERAQWGMAEVLWQQGQHARAIEHMTQAVAISGANPDLLVRLGEMSLEYGDVDRALEQADLALEEQRRHAGAWALRGRVLHKRQLLDEAMMCYHRALSAQPDSPQVQLALAEIYRAVGRPQRALATLDYMTDRQSAEQISPEAWMLKGQALSDLGEDVAARTYLKNAAMCACDDDPHILLALAESQIAAGDFEEARVCLGRAFRSDPYNPAALRLQKVIDDGPRVGVRGNLVGFEQPVFEQPK